MWDSMTRWTIGISPPGLSGISDGQMQNSLSARCGLEGIYYRRYAAVTSTASTHTLYTVISPTSYGTFGGFVKNKISPR